ncbi:MAG TPA: hypothetical protein V6C58_19675 [Allocoleopsis sp.]
MDEMTRNNKKKNLENYKLEIQSITRHKDMVATKIELFKQKTALQEANYKLILQDFEYLKPSWKYEQNPDYIENIKALNIISMEENRIMWKDQLYNMEKSILASEEQLKSLNDAKEKIEKELSEDGKSDN